MWKDLCKYWVLGAPRKYGSSLSDDRIIRQGGHDWHRWFVPWLFEVPGWSASVFPNSFLCKYHLKGLKEKHAVLNQVTMSTRWLYPGGHGALSKLRERTLCQGLDEASELMTQRLQCFQESIFVSDKTGNGVTWRASLLEINGEEVSWISPGKYVQFWDYQYISLQSKILEMKIRKEKSRPGQGRICRG